MSSDPSSVPSMPQSSERWRERLDCGGRPKLSPMEFYPSDKLYRGFKADELDDSGTLDANTLRLPDLSCNWSRISLPNDIRFRMPGCENDGCYSFTVEAARFDQFATICHAPICDEEIENYSHSEIRELFEGESVLSEPPQNRGKKKSRKAKRFAWRTHLINNLVIEFEIGCGDAV